MKSRGAQHHLQYASLSDYTLLDPNEKQDCRDLQGVRGKSPELLILIVDHYRNNQIAEEKNCFVETSRYGPLLQDSPMHVLWLKICNS